MGLMSKHAGDYAAGRIKSPLPSLYADPLKTPFKQRVPVDGAVVLELRNKAT
jgi:hypothetical protein